MRATFNPAKQRDEYLSSITVKDIATHQEKFLQGEEVFEKTLLRFKRFSVISGS